MVLVYSQSYTMITTKCRTFLSLKKKKPYTHLEVIPHSPTSS